MPIVLPVLVVPAVVPVVLLVLVGLGGLEPRLEGDERQDAADLHGDGHVVAVACFVSRTTNTTSTTGASSHPRGATGATGAAGNIVSPIFRTFLGKY